MIRAYVGTLKIEPPPWVRDVLIELTIGYQKFENPQQIEIMIDNCPLIGFIGETDEDLDCIHTSAFKWTEPHYIYSSNDIDREALTRWLLDKTLSANETLAQQNGMNCLALAEMRDHNRTAQIAIAQLKRQLADAPIPLEWTAVDLPDGGSDCIVVIPAGTAARIVQNLPRFSGWLKGLALKIQGLSEQALPLDVAVRGQWSGTAHGQWTVSVTSASPWLRCEFAPDLGELQEPLQISISSDVRPVSRSFSVGLSKTQLLSEFHVQIDGAPPCDRPLTLKLFTGLPGFWRPPVGAIADGRAANATSTIRFITAEQAKAFEIVETASKPDHPIVSYLPDQNGLLVHPTGTAPTVAVLRRIPARPDDRLICDVHHLGDSSSAPVECSLALVPTGRDLSTIKAETGADASELPHTSWIMVRPQHPAELIVEVPSGAESVVDIYMKARSPDGNLHFAWSVFCNLRLLADRDW